MNWQFVTASFLTRTLTHFTSTFLNDALDWYILAFYNLFVYLLFLLVSLYDT